MKQKECKRSQTVNQVKIEFTRKPITPWGGVASTPFVKVVVT